MRKIILLAAMFLTFGVAVQAQYKVRGNVSYTNTALTYLDSVMVYLKQGTSIIGMMPTDGSGHFEFSNVAPGEYEITGICSKKWGGSNSSDAAEVLRHFTHVTTLTGIRAEAANVDLSPVVNTTDALMVTRRFVQLLDSFPSGDWIVETKPVTVVNRHVSINLKAVCTGDVNASFVPPAQFACGMSLTDSRDGQIYPTVLIGEQCWMAKNLNVGTFIYGVGPQNNNYVIEKYCYQNNTANCNTFGGLYQWHEMMQYDTTPGIQGICPDGWHVPTDQEWDTLIYFLGGYNEAGGALKAGGSSGFQALMSGWVFNCQKFRQLGTQAYFWSSTPYYGLYGYDRILYWNNNTVGRVYTNTDDGLSVRCLKD